MSTSQRTLEKHQELQSRTAQHTIIAEAIFPGSDRIGTDWADDKKMIENGATLSTLYERLLPTNEIGERSDMSSVDVLLKRIVPYLRVAPGKYYQFESVMVGKEPGYKARRVPSDINIW